MTTTVAVAMLGDRESAVAVAVEAHPDLTLVRRCADLAEALALAQAGMASVVIVSDQPRLNRMVVADLAALGAVVVAVPTTASAGADLAALGIVHVTDAAADPGIVADRAASAAETVVTAPAIPAGIPSAPEENGVIIAVWGPTGAPGRTTLAVNMAAECAAGPQAEALVVDVDTYGGAVAQALGLLDEAPGIAALARASLHGNLTDDVAWRHLLTVDDGLKVLSGISRADRWPELSRSALDAVWPLLRRHSAVTVVDCGFSIAQDEEALYDTRAPERNGATLSALAAADAVVVVGTAEPLGIQRLVQALAELGEHPEVSCPRLVVANRVRGSVAGRHPEEAIADALARYSGVDRVWMVPADGKSCDAATLAGQTLRERVPRSPARRAIAEVALAALAAAQERRVGSVVQSESARAGAPALTD
ncbi:AAA family ATPase [Demequina aurantiaca]|uniref:AAA family ATPase n=1 Tax=Demequina aurantiaca TaxID=676200 RepID=UPI003D32881E